MPHDYENLTYEDLRELLLNGELEHQYMSQYDYEFLLDNEVEFGGCNTTVIDFCTEGLARFEEYQKCLDLPMKGRIDLEEIVKEYQMKALFGQLDEPKVAVIIHRKPKRFIIMIAAVIASFSLVIVTVSAMGYNPIELIRNALNSSNRIATDNRGDGVMLSDDIRVYNSMSEMLEKENLNILYPAKLPDKYEFTEFKITDFGDILVAGSYNIEPYISFEIRIGAGIPIEDYSHEINGIRYTITERDSMYDVAWSYGTDYYTIVVGDKTIISEIIENLKES